MEKKQTIATIIRDHLKTNSYDGLYHPGLCACYLNDDLFDHCYGDDCLECIPGYKGLFEFEGEMVEGIVGNKP